MTATILDTVTGETKVTHGPRSWDWAEGNWSCDCNRNVFGVDTGKPDIVCGGCYRFLVVDAIFDDDYDYLYTLQYLNKDYPEDLKAKFLPKP